jgi:hypothetical protein
LFAAVEAKNLDVIDYLLSRKADPNVTCYCHTYYPNYGKNLLYIAAEAGENTIVKKLLSYGADLTPLRPEDRKPGHYFIPINKSLLKPHNKYKIEALEYTIKRTFRNEYTTAITLPALGLFKLPSIKMNLGVKKAKKLPAAKALVTLYVRKNTVVNKEAALIPHAEALSQGTLGRIYVNLRSRST